MFPKMHHVVLAGLARLSQRTRFGGNVELPRKFAVSARGFADAADAVLENLPRHKDRRFDAESEHGMLYWDLMALTQQEVDKPFGLLLLTSRGTQSARACRLDYATITSHEVDQFNLHVGSECWFSQVQAPP